MSAQRAGSGRALRTLLRLDRTRLAAAVRHPQAASLVGPLAPLLLLLGVLWAVGRASGAGVAGAEDAVLLGMLVAGPISFLAYGVLFRAGDEPLLRRLGVDARALYVERVLRLLLTALGVAALALVPSLAGGAPAALAAHAAAAAALAAWGAGALALSGAARALARHQPGRGWGMLQAGFWDQELAAAAPLVWAPLLPFVTGTAAAAVAAFQLDGAPVRTLAVALAAMAAAAAGAPAFVRALPRFAPQVQELAFSPPPPAEGGELGVGQGVGRLLPRRVAAVSARDAVVAGRRFPWAARAAWPVAIGAFVALARWGRLPETQAWVALAGLLALLLQGAASVGLGRLERSGRRWMDHALGLGWPTRLAGRWAWGSGLSVWLTVPLALSWQWWSGAGMGWLWVVAGAAVAGVAALASVAAGGWR